ncbi:MAG: DUF433 domain-containing protein [Planctomycetota bacterium]|nr:DUF433 domain-containing protein [Planctomycetota bacterium]
MSINIASHIESNPKVCGGKPCIAGTRIRVQDIYIWHEHQGLCPDEIVSKFPHLTLADVHSALAYYWDNRDEINRQMKDSETFVESMKRNHSSKLRAKLTENAKGDSVPSG